MPTEAGHGGTDLSRRGRARHRAGDGARPERRVPRRGRGRTPAACSRRPSGCSSSSARSRVRDTPISEQAILGAAMGAAMTGLRPIAEIMFSDFFAVCFDYIANEFAKSRYMTNGQVKCPLVVRTGNGAGSRFGAQHSQSVENWAMMIPGLKVVAPFDAARRGRPDGGRGARSRSGDLLRAQVALRDQGRGAGRRDRRPARHRQDRAAGQGRHHPGARPHGAARARRRREAQGASTASTAR